MPTNLEKSRREDARWCILRILDAARPIGTNERIILNTLQCAIPDFSRRELRRELDYLWGRKIIDLEKKSPTWFALLNSYGIDIVEYTVDCEPGIARPDLYQELHDAS